MIEIRFELLRDGAQLPTFKKNGDVAADIYLPEDVNIPLFTRRFDGPSTWHFERAPILVPTGLRTIPPPGYHLEIYLRSSTAIRYPGLMLANQVGLVDEGFTGPEDEIALMLVNMGTQAYNLKKGERIAQLKLELTLQYKPILTQRKDDQNVSREPASKSRGGFGSTGQ